MPIDKRNYAWLDRIEQPLPRMIVEARKLHGVTEAALGANNPVILGWATEVGGKLPSVFPADSVPWCGLFMSVVAKRAAKTPPADPYWALNWGKFGQPAGQPMLGDVLTFVRREGGHVALYIGEDTTTYHVLGGNQTDQVCYTRIEKIRLKSARRTPYTVQPAGVRPYILSATGGVSTNEA